MNYRKGNLLRSLALCAMMFALGFACLAAPRIALADGLADGTYGVPGLESSIGMYHFTDPYVVVRGADAYLITTSEEGNTTMRYSHMAYGPQTQILDESDASHKTLVAGTPIAEGLINYDADGTTMLTRTFVLPVPKSILESGDDIFFMIRYADDYTSGGHGGDWYAARGGDYRFFGYSLEYASDSTLLPGETPAPDEDYIELDVTNDADGLSAEEASAAIDEEGAAELTVDVDGKAGYLYAGTLDQALDASGDTSEWVAGEAQENGTTRFVIPIAISATYLPFAVVDADDVSDIAANLHPYQFELDLSAATLKLERYDQTHSMAVELSCGIAPAFAVAKTANMRVVGDPNDQLFKCVVTLQMDDESYDYIEYTSMVEGELAPAGASLSDGSFLLVFENSAGKKSFSLGEPINVSVHHADSDLWLTRTLTIDLAGGIIRIDGSDDSEDVVKALIESLVRDPIDVRNDDDGAIARAASAYDALSAAAQAKLDKETLPFSTVPYGRVLEADQWAVDAMTVADASTVLPDGVYTSGIESTSSIGKSPSSRAKAFTVKSVTVKDGVAIATIEHESTTDGIVHANGREYANNPPVNNKDYRTYDVPIDLNSTFHLVWKALDSGDSVTAVAVEMTNSIDESRTAPDSPLPSKDEGSSEGDKEVIDSLLDIIDKLRSQGAGASSGATVNPNASTASNSSALAAAAASRTGNNARTSSAGTSASAAPSAQASLGKGAFGSDGLDGLASTTGAAQNTSNAPLAIIAGILCAAALGALGFALRFVHREDK